MNMKSLAWAALACLAGVAISSAASAEEAYVAETGTLRAGPDYDFPEIRTIPRDRIIEVFGCTTDYEWCDVEYRGDRGWFPGDNMEFYYEGRRAPLPWVAPLIGLVILDFAIDDYWGRYYHGRPWFHERDHWRDWHPHESQHRPPPPPPADWPKRLGPSEQHQPGKHFERDAPSHTMPNEKHFERRVPEVRPQQGQPSGGGIGGGDHKRKFCPPGQNCD